MEPKLLEMKARRHQLIAAGSGEIPAANAGCCLASARAMSGPDQSPWLLTVRSKKTLLLVSDDARLGVRASETADLAELAFQQIDNTANALRLAAQDHPAVVLLDLDLPASAAWEATERFLEEENSPPLVLMTGRTGHFELGMAVCAGMILDKSIGPNQLLEQVHGLLTKSDMDQERDRACQRLLVRWLRPCEWTVPVSPDYRHWGINE